MTVINPGGSTGSGIPAPSAAMPGSPTDGQLWLYPADPANGVNWLFRYNAGSASAHKWELVGGPPMRVEIVTFEGTASAVYTDLTTLGPSITAQFAGDYDITCEAYARNSLAGSTAFMGPALGATLPTDNDAARMDSPSANAGGNIDRHSREVNVPAATLIAVKYRAGAGTASFGTRVLLVRPVRVG